MADHESLFELSAALVSELAAAGKTVSTAESCSGGWIAKAITDIPGSSEVFSYGIVSYSNAAKESLLGVTASTLRENGAVSKAVVAEMASAALRLSGADIAIAVSGVAGPTGGSDEKPVGMVWFAWAVASESVVEMDTQCMQFSGDRDSVRESTVWHGLQGIRERMQQ